MKKILGKMLFVCVLTCAILVGCDDTEKKPESETTQTSSNKESSTENNISEDNTENISEKDDSIYTELLPPSENEESVTRPLCESYTINEDGTFTCADVIFEHKLDISTDFGVYTVLSHTKDVSYDDIFQQLISSTITSPDEADFIIITTEASSDEPELPATDMEYIINENGGYTYENTNFDFKFVLSDGTTSYTVLSNTHDVSFQDAVESETIPSAEMIKNAGYVIFKHTL